MTTYHKIQIRQDTAANFNSVNPVLLQGELAIETDTRRKKPATALLLGAIFLMTTKKKEFYRLLQAELMKGQTFKRSSLVRLPDIQALRIGCTLVALRTILREYTLTTIGSRTQARQLLTDTQSRQSNVNV